MSGPLLEVWEASSATPFYPSVPKASQFSLGLTLLVTAILLTSVFALDRSTTKLFALGLPASILFGFGAVFMICGVGVYV